jgi:ribosomal protein L11 methyltransferase
MDWLELSLTCSPEAAEAVSEVLARYAEGGVAVEAMSFTTNDQDRGVPVGPVIVRAYLPQDDKLEANKVAIADGLSHLNMILDGALPAPNYREVGEQDWAESWKASFKPIRVGKRLLIVPAWLEQEARSGDIVVKLDPGMAFGTGTHPTTQLCLAAIERHLAAGQPVIDLGTGSGILAIAAVKLGAPVVWAYDIDEEAVRVATENARDNGVGESVQVACGSLAELRAQQVQAPFVLANILARVLVDLFGQGLADLVAPGGLIVLSGILDAQAYQVRAALTQAGLAFVAQKAIEDWVAILARKPQP